jgi:hypothetical protein
MADSDFTSPSGVRIAADFRDNLIIDRYDPVFADMRASKLRHMQSANSEDAVSWNVFRSLRQIDPAAWLPTLWKRGFPDSDQPADMGATVDLWVSVQPPAALLLGGAEGPSEVDVIIQTESWVWFLEAKYKSDISERTTTRADRDQIIRNIDVGSLYAGARPFYFTLLIASDKQSPVGVKTLEGYSDLSVVREKLRPHRPDGLANLAGVGVLTWNDLGVAIRGAYDAATREDERQYAMRAWDWMKGKELVSL